VEVHVLPGKFAMKTEINASRTTNRNAGETRIVLEESAANARYVCRRKILNLNARKTMTALEERSVREVAASQNHSALHPLTAVETPSARKANA
jgi:hypothetical protein